MEHAKEENDEPDPAQDRARASRDGQDRTRAPACQGQAQGELSHVAQVTPLLGAPGQAVRRPMGAYVRALVCRP
jgi:hypothetical protein